MIAANRSVKPEVQTAIAKKIAEDLLLYEDVFAWKALPTDRQLKAVCNMVFDYLEAKSLRDMHIWSGDSLAWHIGTLQRNRNPSQFLKEVVSRDSSGRPAGQVISHLLGFLRNIVCQRFPQQLRMIDSIQREVFVRRNRAPPGDFQAYASMVENMFMDSALFALDEYGVPLQLALKLEKRLAPNGKLDEVLTRLRSIDIRSSEFHAFEREVLEMVISGM